MDKKILLNKAKCKLCGDILISHHRHDFKMCSCGNMYVDGGREYLKRGWIKPDSIEELSEFEGEKKWKKKSQPSQ